VAAIVRVVVVAGLSCIVVVVEAVMYWGRGGLPTVVHQLVGRCVLAMVLGRLFLTMRGLEDVYVVAMSCRRRTLAGIALSRRRALHLLYHCALE
jgi:hypothetical protein